MTVPLVFLPGMMCDARLFGPQIDAFSENMEVLDLPIHAHVTVEALAADVLKKSPDNFALVGLSMGGIVAMEVIRQAPERVAGIAMMDTNPKAEHPSVADGRPSQIARVRESGLVAVMRDEMKPNYLADTPNRTAILELCMEMAVGLGPQAFENQSLALMTRPDQQETLKAYRRPALILCGEQDALCPIHRHSLMHALMPHSTLTVLPDAGHLPTLEQPDVTIAAMKSWLSIVHMV